MVIALAGVYFGHLLNNPYLDGSASIAIGVLLVGVALFLIYKTKRLLVGTGVDDETVDAIEALVRAQPNIDQVGPPLTSYLGPTDVVLALDVEFAHHLTAEEIEHAIDGLQDAIRAKYPEMKRIFIEAKALSNRAA